MFLGSEKLWEIPSASDKMFKNTNVKNTVSANKAWCSINIYTKNNYTYASYPVIPLHFKTWDSVTKHRTNQPYSNVNDQSKAALSKTDRVVSI